MDYLKKELFIVLITGMTLHTHHQNRRKLEQEKAKKEAIEKLIK
ncbi:hypothetical protein HMPREF1621_00002 [Escherichia coli A25922R]|nr:hypothetical protein HMPREF1593_00174 [Escherichia coli 907391]ESE38795.1 hypothetical protein HMPREF1621_00002 [Escherichia coli A25922R]